MGSFNLGKNARLYYKAGGVNGAGDWIWLRNCKNVRCPWEKGNDDVTVQGSGDVRRHAGNIKDLPLDFDLLVNKDTASEITSRDAMITSYTGNSVVGFRWLNDVPSDPKVFGYQGDYEVMKIDAQQEIDKVQILSIGALPAETGVDFEFLDAGEVSS